MPERLRDRYEVLDVVGRGGQGEVVKALDHLHDRVVAIKVRPSSPDQQDALLDEARILLNLEPHQGLPLVRDDFFQGDHYYMVMDWIEGTNLQQVVEQRGDPGLPYSTVLSYLSPVAEALDHLHAQEPPVVHQDVKPSNLVLSKRGRVVLVDLGIASSGREATRGGTHGYIAPELAAGADPTPAADVFGLAATAYTLLTGAPPRGDRPGREDAPDGWSKTVERALGRALSVDPERRPGSARELLDGLRMRLEPHTAAGDPGVRHADVATAPTNYAPAHRTRAPLRLTRRTALVLAVASLVSITVGVLLITSPWRGGSIGLPPINSLARIEPDGEIADAVPVGTEPTHVVLGAGDLWVANVDDKTISQVDPESGQVSRVISSGGTPTDIAADEEGVFVVNGFEGTVVKIDPSTSSVAATVEVAVGSRNIAVGEGSVWVTNIVDNTLTELDADSLERLDTVDLPGAPEDVAVGMGAVWIADGSNQDLLRFDPAADHTETLGLRFDPSSLVVGDGTVWVASKDDDSVTNVDPASGSGTSIPVGNDPAGLAVSADAVWVTNYLSGDVSRIDPDTDRVIGTTSVGNSPEGVVANESGVWVTVNTR